MFKIEKCGKTYLQVKYSEPSIRFQHFRKILVNIWHFNINPDANIKSADRREKNFFFHSLWKYKDFITKSISRLWNLSRRLKLRSKRSLIIHNIFAHSALFSSRIYECFIHKENKRLFLWVKGFETVH